ncbi:MAG: asparagine synthase (glutamine-hydrolyzing) [Deltaproteobacteria bacterium]|nr:asparagine synthase (glutamine-hydrolyzing) [Deltaproteobacteria bacterium]
MCGIVGMIRPGKQDPTRELEDALKRLAHRGPDDRGTWFDTTIQAGRPFTVGLGHVRLSILDLSPKGRQPMVSKDGAVIVHNGEIYNYLELREGLKEEGYTFHTDTDTEVILAAYHRWGPPCVDHFIGMWAFAIWDGATLFVSRDRLGKKPLYFYHDTTTRFLAFASEIKAFKGIDRVAWLPDEKTVFRYLAFGEMEQHGATFYQGIREYPAGRSLSYAPGDTHVRPRRYWTLSDEQYDVDEKEAVVNTAELLHDSLRLRLRSDAPLGLSLSGWLDSTLLLALMNEYGLESPPVFSSGYAETGYNETRYTEIATRHLKCAPKATTCDATQFQNDFEHLVYHLDQPSRLPGPYSQWQVARLASNDVKVLIDGQGADELAGGYVYYLPLSIRESWWMDTVRDLADLMLTAWANRHVLSQYPRQQIWERISGRAGIFQNRALRKAWASQFEQEAPAWTEFMHLNPMLRHALLEGSLPPLLRYGDRVSMAFGIENRCPFLDHRLVAYVSALPASLKIRGGQTKWIFRMVAKGKIPDAIRTRRMKMGFPTPVGSWLRNSLLQSCRRWFYDYQGIAWFNRWVNTEAALYLLEEHASRRHDHQALLWRLLSVGAWLKTAELQ